MKLQLFINKIVMSHLKFKSFTIVCILAVFSVFAADVDKKGDQGLLNLTKVPIEIQLLVERLLNDSMCSYGLNEMKSDYSSIDPAIRITDLSADIPIRQFYFDWKKIRADKNISSVSEVVKPVNSWIVAIRAKGKIIYLLELAGSNKDQPARIAGTGNGSIDRFEAIGYYWPQTSGFIPIHIEGRPYICFHFPQLDKCNLWCLNKYPGEADPDAISEKDILHKSSKIENEGNIQAIGPYSGAFLYSCIKVYDDMREVYHQIEEEKQKYHDFIRKKYGNENEEKKE